MPTQSEDLITKISSGIFYKEFTFDKNQFGPKEQVKELADNALWLDDILFIIQVKERSPASVKSEVEENKWFQNTVLGEAKKQIRDSVQFFSTYEEIKVKNVRDHEIDISKANLDFIRKIIIYEPNSELINSKNKSIGFYQSSSGAGNIHIFNAKDYSWICKILVTPTELDEYLEFRERLYIKYKDRVEPFTEQYILGNFFHTNNEDEVREEFMSAFEKLADDLEEYDVSNIVDSFPEKLRVGQQESLNYYLILKEIAHLRRYELAEFKERYIKIVNDVSKGNYSRPYRFTCVRRNCGFVFIPLQSDESEYWENALINYTEIYKYKRGLKKCVGVVAYKTGVYFDINWAFVEDDWIHNDELEKLVQQEEGIYGDGEIRPIIRYKLKD